MFKSIIAALSLSALLVAPSAKAKEGWDHCLTEKGLAQCVDVIDAQSANVVAKFGETFMFDIYITCTRIDKSNWNAQWIGRYNAQELSTDAVTQYSKNFCGGYLGYTKSRPSTNRPAMTA